MNDEQIKKMLGLLLLNSSSRWIHFFFNAHPEFCDLGLELIKSIPLNLTKKTVKYKHSKEIRLVLKNKQDVKQNPTQKSKQKSLQNKDFNLCLVMALNSGVPLGTVLESNEEYAIFLSNFIQDKKGKIKISKVKQQLIERIVNKPPKETIRDFIGKSVEDLIVLIGRSGGEKSIIANAVLNVDGLVEGDPGYLSDDDFDYLVEVNECILQKIAREKMPYPDLTKQLIESNRMWNEQELKLVSLLDDVCVVLGHPEAYRSRVRDLFVKLSTQSSSREVRDILIQIKQRFPKLSSKKLANML